jgi:hypothetical protein
MRHYLLVGLMMLSFSSLTPQGTCARIPAFSQYGIAGFDRDLGVIDGEVSWSNPDGKNWQVKDTKKGHTIRLLSDDKWDGWYLTCDPKGKRKTLFLLQKLTDGSYWSLSNVGGPQPTFIFAIAGKGKGWSLYKGKTVKRKDKDGKPYTAYQAIVSKTPKPVPKFKIYTVAK